MAYLLGFHTRGALFNGDAQSTPSPKQVATLSEAEPNPAERVEPPLASVATPAEEEVIYVDIPYDPTNPVERLQALEKMRYNVPGSAFSRLVENTFNRNNYISAPVSALMELSIDESDHLNRILDDTVSKMRAIEAQLVYDRVEPNGDVTLVIPSFSDAGLEIRDQLLLRIENELGSDRRHILEMMLLQKPSSFGNFGGEPMAVRNPRFESVNGWREMVTIDIGKIVDAGTDDERFEGVQKVYQLGAFKKRYGHLFVFEDDSYQ